LLGVAVNTPPAYRVALGSSPEEGDII
jgi:hypothetical protein